MDRKLFFIERVGRVFFYFFRVMVFNVMPHFLNIILKLSFSCLKGISDRLIRVSVGLEDQADLQADWSQALGR